MTEPAEYVTRADKRHTGNPDKTFKKGTVNGT